MIPLHILPTEALSAVRASSVSPLIAASKIPSYHTEVPVGQFLGATSGGRHPPRVLRRRVLAVIVTLLSPKFVQVRKPPPLIVVRLPALILSLPCARSFDSLRRNQGISFSIVLTLEFSLAGI